MTWILVIHIYAGLFSETDSLSVTSVPGFATEQACKAAGSKADALVKSTKKEVKYICVSSN